MSSKWNPEISEIVTEGLDALRVGLAIFDASDVLIYCNEHFRHLYRSLESIDEVVGLSFADILQLVVNKGEIAGREVIEDPAAWVERRLQKHREPDGQPLEEQLADGRWIQVKVRALPDGGVIGVWQDITSLQTSNLRLADAVDAIGDGFAIWDQRDQLVAHNARFAELFAGSDAPLKSGDSFEGATQRLLAHGLLEDEPAAEAQVEAWRQAHHQLFGRTVIRYRDQRWFLIKERRTRDGGMVSLLTDITDIKNREHSLVLRGKSLERTIGELSTVQGKLKQQGGEIAAMAEELSQAKRAVEQADASKTRFLRSISHELRTPLNAIIGFAEVLRDGLLGPLGHHRYQEYANDIHSSGSHLLGLVNQLLDLSRIEAGRYELECEPQDVGVLIRNSARLMAKQIEDAGLELVCEIPSDPPALVADQQAVRQILVNLLSNAVKFTPSGGEIRISIGQEAEQLAITVTDTGIGIPAEKMSGLMRPFERVDNDLNRQTEGTGLGLAISRSLAEMHGGTLDLNSVLGNGTTAVLRLPSAGPGEQVHYFPAQGVGA